MGSMAHPMSEPPYRAPQHFSGASGSQGDLERRRAEENKGLTTEALAAHGGDSFSHLHRRVAASVSRSNCPASSSTAIEGPEEYEELRKKMDDYILHEEYYKSIRGEDGEEPLAVPRSRPRTDLGSYAHSGPPSDRAETASLPRRPRPEYPRPCCPTPRAPEVGPTRIEEQHHPRPTYGALDHTAELLAKLLSGSEDPDVTALSEAIKAKLGIAEPLPKPELPSLSPGLSTLAEDLKRSRVSRLLPKVTCPSPFHPRARTVPMADLQDVPVTEIERRGLSALAPLAGVSPSGLTPGGGKTGRPIAQANIQLELPEFDPKNLPKWAEEFAEFLLLTGQSHVDVATKCSLLKRSCKKKILTVHHIPGIKNELSDYISRNNFDALIGESSEALAKEAFQRMDVQLDLSMRTAGILEGWSLTDYQSEYEEILQTLSTGLEPRVIDGHQWYKNNQYLFYEDRIVVPEARLDGCLQWSHLSSGHTGANRSVDFFRECFYSSLTLTELRSRMQTIVDACGCHASKQSDSRNRGLISSLPIPYCANSLLYVDFIHGLPRFGGYDSCLVVTCGLSRFTRVFPCNKKITGEQTVKMLVEQWFEPYGAPKQVHSDEDVRIRSDTGWYKRVLNALNVEVTTGVPYTHTSNPLCERQNRVVEQNLRILMKQERTKDWVRLVPWAVHSMNSQRSSSTGFTPHELFHGG